MGLTEAQKANMKTYVITTDRGFVYVVMAHSAIGARNTFNTRKPGLSIAAIVEAEEQL